jgi:nucleoid-associated protein YgaU
MLTRQHHFPRTRCVLVLVAATAGVALLGRLLVPGAADPVQTVDEAVARICLVALLGASAWAWLATLSVVAEAWRGRPGRRRVAAPLRRVVLLCCGVALTTPVGAASGDDHPAPGPAIAGLPLPDRATGPAHRLRPSAPPTPRTVVVRAGDSLWHLAAADLPAGASAARVTARWQAIHHVNAGVIGPDPDLIHPGQRLSLPPAHPATHPPGEPRR